MQCRLHVVVGERRRAQPFHAKSRLSPVQQTTRRVASDLVEDDPEGRAVNGLRHHNSPSLFVADQACAVGASAPRVGAGVGTGAAGSVSGSHGDDSRARPRRQYFPDSGHSLQATT